MKKGTISMGLRRIKTLKGKMAELSVRAAACVSYTQDKAPTFDFDECSVAMEKVREELLRLESSVARANALTEIEISSGRKVTLTEAIRRLQELKGQIDWLKKLPIRDGSEEAYEPDYDEETGRSIRRKVKIVWITKLSEKSRVQKVDALKDEFERLNTLVESANHRTEVDWSPTESVAA